jgi:glutamate formiminotransferase
MRLAMYVSMYIYTYEKVSLYRATEHKIYVCASSYVCVYVHPLKM